MNLVMLTKFYPYGTGEAFIENEMNVLSQYYDRILVIACEAPDGAAVRSVPENVTVEKISGVNSKGKLLDVIKGQIYHINSSPEFRSEKKHCRSLKQKAFLGYFEAKSRRIYNKIKNDGLFKEFAGKPFVLYSYWLFMTSRAASLIQKDYQVKYSFSRAHSYDLYTERNALNYLPYRELFLDRLNKVFPCSDNGKIYLQKRYPEYKEKIMTSFLGTLDHGTGISGKDGVFHVVSCSRISKEKRVEKIINGLALLESKGMNIEWTHIGGGQGLNDIKKQAEEKLKNIKAVFVGDVPNAEVLEMYKSRPFDIFMNVSSIEGLPVSIMEAISFGIPVVATNVGGTSEIVKNGVTGQLIEKDFKDEDLAQAIERFFYLKETDEYENYRTKCRAFWKEHFQAVKNYNELFRYIEKERQSLFI